jgi:hypothetical protein
VQTRIFRRRCHTEIDARVRLPKTEADARQPALGFETVLSLVTFFVSRGGWNRGNFRQSFRAGGRFPQFRSQAPYQLGR